MVDDYVSFVEQQIGKLKASSRLIRENQITPQEVNRALAEYMPSLLALQVEYQRAKIESYQVEAEYNDWWDKKFVETKDKLNDPELPKSKWASKTEIETQTRADNQSEYRAYQDKIKTAEYRVRFFLRLLEGWEKQDRVLVTLANNMRSEMIALSLDNRANADPNRHRVRKVAQPR